MNIITIEELYDDLKNKPEDIILINVLSATDFENCHIPGSINIPLAELPSKLDTLDKTKKIVVHCAHEKCPSSENAYKILSDAGFTNIYDYKRGIREWLQNDLKLEGRCEAAYLHELDQRR